MTIPIITSSAELRGHEAEQVRIRGHYGVQDLGRHAIKVRDAAGEWKRIRKVAYVRLADEHYVALENRPDDEMVNLSGRLVIATGKLVTPAEPPAHPAAARPAPAPTLVDIVSIEAVSATADHRGAA